MKGNGVAAQHHELRACIVQLDEHVAEVVRKLDHLGGPGTKPNPAAGARGGRRGGGRKM